MGPLKRRYLSLFGWLQGKILSTKEVGFFPSDAVKPCPCVSVRDFPPSPHSPLQTRLLRFLGRWFRDVVVLVLGFGFFFCFFLIPAKPPSPLDVAFHLTRGAAQGV